MTKTSKSSLAETHPELAAQADGWDPTTLTAWSKEKVGWKCELGHIWVTSVQPRKQGSGCPYCAGQKPIVGLNDLSTTHPELAAQADGWDPATAKAGTNKKMKWRCQRGHNWDASVSSRARLGSGCPICSNQKVLSGFNDLATTHPELAVQADGWDPRSVIAGTNKKLLWRCSLGHNFTMNGNARAFRGLNCPICSGQEILLGFNDLATTHPEISAQMVKGDPTTVSKGSDKKFLWRCESGHNWTTTVGSRTQGAGCPYCQGLLTIVGVNDLVTTHPELAAQADGWNPQNFKRGSTSVKKTWQCHLGHKWKANISDRAIQGQGCPYCGGKRALKGFNDLATTHPKIAIQADGWDPSTVTRGSEYKRRWKCELGHIWDAIVVNRTNLGHGCAVCAGKQINVGVNDIATTNPELAAEAYGWDPTKVTSHSSKKVKWKCSEGHIWTAQIANRSNGRGCPSCSRTGFKPDLLGFIYFIDHFDLNMFQIGISNSPEDRLGDHKSRGWEVIELRGPMDGHLTQKLETDCLHALEKRGAILGHKAGMDKFDGYSEAWTKKSLNVTSIKQILDWVYEDESK